MPEPDPETNASAPRPSSRPGPSLGTDQILYAVLTVLAIIGMGVADFSAGYGLGYWLFMVPIFAGACIYIVWDRARGRGESAQSILWKSCLHWSMLPLAMYVIYLLESTGRLNQEDAGLVALMSLALTTLLAAVHFDWRLGFLGLILSGTALASALVEEFFWMALIPVVLLGGAAFVWHRRGGTGSAG